MDSVYLQGSEDVARAGHNMQNAANGMQRAASTFESSAERLIKKLNEAVMRMADAADRIEKAMAPQVTISGEPYNAADSGVYGEEYAGQVKEK